MMRRTAAHPRIGLPAVNLLSQSSFDRLSARRLRHRFVAAGVVLTALVGAGWGVQHVRVAEAQKLVVVEQGETARLDARTQTLAPVRAFVGGVAVQEGTVESAMAREIYFSAVLAGIRAATPSGARLAAVSVVAAPAPTAAAPTGAAGSVCPGPDPFNTRTVVGCVTLSGTATSRAEVGQLVTSLGAADLFVEPFIATTTTADSSEVSFSGSVGLSKQAFSTRYASLAQALGPGVS
ncbi:MAG: Fimbrial assembly family protein [Nocardioides sp.]|jgi:hypothetical protein|nr:Fimbrial assembly family protein [Nocardioides sp.]